MPIVGVLLVLDCAYLESREGVADRLAQLEHAPDLVLGEPSGHRWPAVLDARDKADVESWIDRLRDTTGIASVDVVYADFEDLLEPADAGAWREA